MKKIPREILEESQEFQKYWDLANDHKISNREVNDLIALYYKYSDPRNKCTAAILLSLIDSDKRIPAILLDALKYWDKSGYAGWVMTTNGRLFNYYPEYREKYLDLMFNGKISQRNILANSLFFIQEKLRDISENHLQKIKEKFARKEKNFDLKRVFLFKLNLKKNLKFVNDLVVKYDPLDLIKNGAKNNVYETAIHSLSGFYRNQKEKKRKLGYIKSDFYSEFQRVPSDKILEKMISKINRKM